MKIAELLLKNYSSKGAIVKKCYLPSECRPDEALPNSGIPFMVPRNKSGRRPDGENALKLLLPYLNVKLGWFVSIFLCFFILLPGARIYAQEFYTSNGYNLTKVNFKFCSQETIAKIEAAGRINDITFDPNGLLYGIEGNGTLYEINKTDGSTRIVAKFEGSQTYNSLVCSASGIIYATGGRGILYAYDINSKVISNLGEIGVGAAGDLTFHDGKLFMASVDNTLVEVNLDNPANSKVFMYLQNSIRGIFTLADDCNQIITYASNSRTRAEIFEIDFENKSLRRVCTVSTLISGAASSFEFKGSVKLTIENVSTTGTECGEDNGSVTVSAQLTGSDATLTYSLDGVNFQPDNVFTNVASGNYTVTVQDEEGCFSTSVQANVAASDAVIIDEIQKANASCGLNNGSITVFATKGNSGLTYSINGGMPQSSHTFSDLAPGDYTITILNEKGCSASSSVINIPVSFPLSIENVSKEDPICGEANGQIVVTAAGGNGNLQYSLNNGSYQDEPVFTNLSGGNYTVAVLDETECAAISQEINLSETRALQIDTILVEDTVCQVEKSSIEIEVSGGDGNLLYSLGGNNFQSSPVFSDLSDGTYTITIRDKNRCELQSEPVSVNKSCPIDVYVPTAFTPNNDGLNDYFQIFSVQTIKINNFSVYNRWGNLVYTGSGFYADETERFWDGWYQGNEANSGVYNYQFEVENEEQQKKIYKGIITLIR